MESFFANFEKFSGYMHSRYEQAALRPSGEGRVRGLRVGTNARW